MRAPFPVVWLELLGLQITDTVVITLVMSALVLAAAQVVVRVRRFREAAEMLYEALVQSIQNTVNVDVRALVPLVLSLWVFIGVGNLIGLVPGVRSPTGDLSLTVALASISFFAGHVHAFQQEGLAYVKHYLEPTPWLLPLNIVSELSRTLALALRLFGNALSGNLIAAIAVYLAGILLPIPLMALSLLTGLVQAYIFGILTLVFAASSVSTVAKRGNEQRTG